MKSIVLFRNDVLVIWNPSPCIITNNLSKYFQYANQSEENKIELNQNYNFEIGKMTLLFDAKMYFIGPLSFCKLNLYTKETFLSDTLYCFLIKVYKNP